MSFFRGTQFIPGVGWVQDPSQAGQPLGVLPTPPAYGAQPQAALSGEADVMMISGLGDAGTGAPASPRQLPDWSKNLWWIAIGVVAGFVLATMIHGEKSRSQS